MVMRVIPALAILPSVPLLLGGVAVAGARGPGIRGAGPAGLALVAVVPVVPVAVLVVWVALLGVPVAARVAWVVPVALMVPAVAQAGPRLPQGVAGGCAGVDGPLVPTMQTMVAPCASVTLVLFSSSTEVVRMPLMDSPFALPVSSKSQPSSVKVTRA